MSNKIGIGVLGAGSMGRYVLEETLKQNDRLEVSAIFDPNPEAVSQTLEKLDNKPAICEDLQELVSRDDVDWVMIASPNKDHCEGVLAAFENKKHVFCQKPLGITMQQCLDMKGAWVKSDRLFNIGFTLRYSPHYRKIKELIMEGRIGKIISMEFNETLHSSHGGHIMSCWRNTRESTGFHLLEKCSHDIDLVNWMVESRVDRVASFGGLDFFIPENQYHMDRLEVNEDGHKAYCNLPTAQNGNPFTTKKDIIDNQVVIMEYQNKVRATFHTNLNSGIPERRMYILGTEGAIRSDVLSGTIQLQRIGFKSEIEDVSTDASGGHGGGDEVLANELADSMLNGTSPAVGLIEGLESAVACFAIDEAMRLGTVVQLDSWWDKVELDKLIA